MRNLSLWRSSYTSIPHTRDLISPPCCSVTAVSVDPDQDALYIASEVYNDDAATGIEIWKISEGEGGDQVYFLVSVRKLV